MADFTPSKTNNFPAGVNYNPGTSTILAAGDSGNIKVLGSPGTPAIKLTDMTQQYATTLSSDSTVKGGGNFINGSASVLTSGTINSNTANKVGTYGPAGPSLGYSILGE